LLHCCLSWRDCAGVTLEPELRLAFVVQRYGQEIGGGAELLCREVAEHLVPYADVNVLTTCAQDYATWENAYPAGQTMLSGVRVHRFAVDYPRRAAKFQPLARRMALNAHTPLDEHVWMVAQGPVSSDLLKHIDKRADYYDAFIFITYLYATSYLGIQMVPNKAILIPAAHDEPSLYYSIFRPVFHLPRYLIFNTDAERRLVHSVFGNERIPYSVIGTGVERPGQTDPRRFRQKYGIDGDFLLYVGRLDESKNVPEMLDYFRRYKKENPSSLKLLLMGKGPYSVPTADDIIPLGYVSDQDKFDALGTAQVLVLPSLYESLSIAILEAWMMSCPVLVNGECDVLVEQCLRSNGGLYYRGYDEFSVALGVMLANSGLRRQLASAGAAFTELEYAWPMVEWRYLQVLYRYLGGGTEGGCVG